MKIALLVIAILLVGAVVIAVLKKEDMPASEDSTDWPPEVVAKVEGAGDG